MSVTNTLRVALLNELHSDQCLKMSRSRQWLKHLLSVAHVIASGGRDARSRRRRMDASDQLIK